MKEGLFYEDGQLVYYKKGYRCHAGVIRVDGDIYYIGSKGRAVTGWHVVHKEMTNGILKHGTYQFGEDYKLVEGSYSAPQKQKVKKRHSSAPRKRKKRLKKWSRKELIGLSAAAVLVLCLVGVGWVIDRSFDDTGSGAPGSAGSQMDETAVIGKEVVLCSHAAQRLYEGEITAEVAAESGEPYRPLVINHVFPNAAGTLMIGEREDLSDGRTYELKASGGTVSVHNLKPGTTYHYRLTMDGEDTVGTFETAQTTRFVYMPGVKNARDIGGYTTLDGKRVKYGKLIRGSELDGLVESTYFLPGKDVEAVQDTFGFVYDFDLRAQELYTGNYQSRLGADVGHSFYGSPQYGGIFNQAGRVPLSRIFKDLADPNKYPMYLHCTYGADRTGTIIFLLQGLLNVSEEDMIDEYCLTGFFRRDCASPTAMEVVISGLQSYPGTTLQEKIVSFMKTDVGLTDAEIQSIRTILLEEG